MKTNIGVNGLNYDLKIPNGLHSNIFQAKTSTISIFTDVWSSASQVACEYQRYKTVQEAITCLLNFYSVDSRYVTKWQMKPLILQNYKLR